MADMIIPKRAVVVTGASSGIGRATALHLEAQGFRVFAGVRRTEDADALRAEASDRLTPIMLDVTDTRSIAAAQLAVDRAVEGRGLHGLVNNAGIACIAPVEFVPIEDMREQLEVNVTGVVAVTQAFAEMLRTAGGRIVNIGSVNGMIAPPLLGPYAASKYALEALTDSMRVELAPSGIDVSLIQLGPTESSIWDKNEAYMDRLLARAPDAARARYGAMIEGLRRMANQSDKRPADDLAAVIFDALTADRPLTRYRVGPEAKLMLVLRLLPDRVRDWIIRQQLS